MPRPDGFTTGKETWYPLYRRLGEPQVRSGRVWKMSPLTGFDPRTFQPVACRYTDYVPYTHLVDKDNIFSSSKQLGHSSISYARYVVNVGTTYWIRLSSVFRRKGKLVPIHTMKPYRMDGGTAPPSLTLGTGWRLIGQSHAPST